MICEKAMINEPLMGIIRFLVVACLVGGLLLTVLPMNITPAMMQAKPSQIWIVIISPRKRTAIMDV